MAKTRRHVRQRLARLTRTVESAHVQVTLDGSGDQEAAREMLLEVAQLDRDAQNLVRDLVGVARAAGATWTDVGHAFGITKQGAQQRFGR